MPRQPYDLIRALRRPDLMLWMKKTGPMHRIVRISLTAPLFNANVTAMLHA